MRNKPSRKINQLKGGILLAYFQTGLNTVISLVYTPVMLRLLGQSEYGIYTLASSVISYLGLLNFGLSSSYIRYYTKYRDKGDMAGLAQLNGIFLTVYLGIAAVAGLAGGVLSWNVSALFGKSLTEQELTTARYLMLILTLNMMMTFASTVFAAYISANERFIFQKILNMGKTVLSPLVTIPVLLLGFRSVGMTVVTTVISILVDLSNILYCIQSLRMKISLRGADFRLVGKIASFSVFIAINSIVDQINWQVDKFILARYHGSVETAVYGVASQLNTLYISVSTAISSVYVPRVHHILASQDHDKEYSALFARIGRIQLLVLGLAASGLVLFGRHFIRFWAGEEYTGAYGITLLLILPCTIPLIQNIGIEIQRAKNMHRFRTVVYSIMAVSNVIISIPLGSRYGGAGCALGTAVSLLLCNGLIMNWYYGRRIHLDMRYFWRQMLRILPAILGAALLGALIPGRNSVKSVYLLTAEVLAYSLLYAGLCWLFAMNRSEKQAVSGLFRRAFGRI